MTAPALKDLTPVDTASTMVPVMMISITTYYKRCNHARTNYVEEHRNQDQFDTTKDIGNFGGSGLLV